LKYSLLFERTGLSKNKEKLIELTNNKAVQLLPEDIIRNPYSFEFLGLKQSDVFTETNLEDLLIRHLQDFLLVEYAMEGWDKTLFVSQFQISLPTEDELKEFLNKEKRLGVI